MNGLLEGRVAVVTGAALGIGRATTLAMVEHGASVAVSDLLEEETAETIRLADEIRPGSVVSVLGDVRDPDHTDALVAEAVRAFGRLDVVHANAGITGRGGPVGELAHQTYRDVIDVNVHGVFNTLHSALPHLRASDAASVVITASGAGLIGVAGASAYVSSKHAVVGLMKSAALEYAPEGIRVNAVAPGITETRLLHGGGPEGVRALTDNTPLGRAADPREIANVVVWLGSSMSSFVVGATIVSDGGHSIH